MVRPAETVDEPDPAATVFLEIVKLVGVNLILQMNGDHAYMMPLCRFWLDDSLCDRVTRPGFLVSGAPRPTEAVLWVFRLGEGGPVHGTSNAGKHAGCRLLGENERRRPHP
ncbi:hypothetical protein SGFS_063750 [Streptomyces graminofaciens]|uniref:Uncharacterized protein n=1 Tax=Streptomyces graminofaciens TaxID=68212 RepID=A0ABM7FFB4_9ACTN|nr:hypothetical protein SGFS_063750 [Streptomyces graminofaciens]